MKTLKQFDRSNMHMRALSERRNFVSITESSVDPYAAIEHLNESLDARISVIAQQIIRARKQGSAVICAFGAHTIKNGLGRVLAALIEHGWITHLATNGAGVIHDWEFSYQGESSEDVRTNVQEGKFGTWDETGLYINLALAVGAYQGLGYGQSIGALISSDGIMIPDRQHLKQEIQEGKLLWKRAAAADLLALIDDLGLTDGFMNIEHPYAPYSIQAAAYDLEIPFTSHPMIGHDIIYTHPANRGAVIGRTAERDFLSYVDSVSNLEGGVYLSVGSAVMSPMIFEKSLSMARNVLLPQGRDIRDCSIQVVDLQKETWDWSRGEPDKDNPAYYLRFMKTFSRMGCPVDYLSADNKLFLTGLFQSLLQRDGKA